MRRFVALWLLANAIMLPIVIFVLAPGMPPGNGTEQAAGQVVDNTVLLALSTPVALGVLLFLGYTIWAFRERNLDGPVLDGPAVTGNSSVQMWWLITTTALVLFLAGFGSVRLLEDGSGGGQGPSPLVVPSGKALQVQVIGQQWQFTYRYPAYGLETNSLVLPPDTLVEFHVTSLDVIHSFWAYQLGVKADANPGVDNIAYVETRGPLSFEVRCAELCGVWHGYMYNPGKVASSKAAFASWIQSQQQKYSAASKVLPPYSHTYFPGPNGRSG